MRTSRFWISIALTASLLVLGFSSPRASTPYTIHLQAQSGHYFVAESGGWDVVNADRTSPQGWETFTLHDMNDGALETGDEVFIQTYYGYYFSVSSCDWYGPTSRLRAFGTSTGDCRSSFWIYKLDGSGNIQWGQSITNGDSVAIHAYGGWWIAAEYGGGDIVNVNRYQPSGWETFTITM